jgi:hypothetical protein
MGGWSGIWWAAVARSLVILALSRSAAALGWPGTQRAPPAIRRWCSQQDRGRLPADLLA